MRAFVIILALGLSVSRASAQRSVSVRPVADSGVIRVLAVATFGVLAHALAAAALDTAPQPWRITLPDTLQPEWRQLRAGLGRALRSRAFAATDSVRSTLDLSRIIVQGDTLSAWLEVAGAYRCPNGEWKGGSTGYTVRAVRMGGYWQPPQTRADAFGDSAGCPDISRR